MWHKENAQLIIDLLRQRWVNRNSIVALVCNAEAESTCNAAAEEGWPSMWWGLWQWTPHQFLIDRWALGESTECYRKQIDYLIREDPKKWYWPYSFQDFLSNAKAYDEATLTDHFVRYWERPDMSIPFNNNRYWIFKPKLDALWVDWWGTTPIPAPPTPTPTPPDRIWLPNPFLNGDKFDWCAAFWASNGQGYINAPSSNTPDHKTWTVDWIIEALQRIENNAHYKYSIDRPSRDWRLDADTYYNDSLWAMYWAMCWKNPDGSPTAGWQDIRWDNTRPNVHEFSSYLTGLWWRRNHWQRMRIEEDFGKLSRGMIFIQWEDSSWTIWDIGIMIDDNRFISCSERSKDHAVTTWVFRSWVSATAVIAVYKYDQWYSLTRKLVPNAEMTIKQFYDKYQGKYVTPDGWIWDHVGGDDENYVGQCVSLVKLFSRKCLNYTLGAVASNWPWGSISDLSDADKSHFELINLNTADKSATLWCILIWWSSSSNPSLNAWHTAIWLGTMDPRNNTAGNVATIFDSNWGNHEPATYRVSTASFPHWPHFCYKFKW